MPRAPGPIETRGKSYTLLSSLSNDAVRAKQLALSVGAGGLGVAPPQQHLRDIQRQIVEFPSAQLVRSQVNTFEDKGGRRLADTHAQQQRIRQTIHGTVCSGCT